MRKQGGRGFLRPVRGGQSEQTAHFLVGNHDDMNL